MVDFRRSHESVVGSSQEQKLAIDSSGIPDSRSQKSIPIGAFCFLLYYLSRVSSNISNTKDRV